MFAKIIIVLLILIMLFVLGRALLFMLKDRGQTDRTLNALKWRVGIWAVLFGFILLGLKFGYITPSNSLAPKPAEQTPVPTPTSTSGN